MFTDPSKSKLRKKTERRVTFAELVRTAMVKTTYTTNSDIAVNGSQVFCHHAQHLRCFRTQHYLLQRTVNTAVLQPENSDLLIQLSLSTPLPLKSARFVAFALACTVSAVWLLQRHRIGLKNVQTDRV
jgi:hypothetical protein